eukprot:gene17290-20576_t
MGVISTGILLLSIVCSQTTLEVFGSTCDHLSEEGQCPNPGEADAKSTDETSKAKAKESEGSGSSGSTGDSTAEDVANTFDSIDSLLETQVKVLAELQDAVRLQVDQINELRVLAGKDPKHFQNLHAKASWQGYAHARGAGAPSYDGSGTGLVSHAAGMGLDKTIAKHKAAWYEYMQLMSAVKVDTEVSCLHLLPQDGGQGLARYFAVGDQTGKVYFFRPQGDLLLEYHTGLANAVTSITSYVIRKNETMIITGHEDGSVGFHKLSETIHKDSTITGEDLYILGAEHKLTVSLSPPNVSGISAKDGEEAGSGLVKMNAPLGPVKVVETYRQSQRRFIVAANPQGEITIFKENGTLHGAVQSPTPIVEFRSNAQHILYITETGVGSVDLRTLEVLSAGCTGLNESTITSARFDSTVNSKVYAVTAEGDVLTLFLSGEKKMDCNVRSRRQAGLMPPAALAPIKGYLVAATADDLWAFNITGAGRGGPRYVLQEDLDVVGMAFGHAPSSCSVAGQGKPMMVNNKQRQ